MGGLEGITGIIQNQQFKSKHTINTKIPLVRFEGILSYNGEIILNCESGNPCINLHDNSRAYASYVGRLIWPTAVFKDDNNSVAINLGYTHDDTNSAFDWLFITENVQAGRPCDERSQKGLYVWDKHPLLNEHFEATLRLEFQTEATHRLGNNMVLLKVRLLSS